MYAFEIDEMDSQPAIFACYFVATPEKEGGSVQSLSLHQRQKGPFCL
jgi:hypothetical protein